MRRASFALLLACASALQAQQPAAVPQAVQALEHLKPRSDAGPVSWTAGQYQYDGAGNIIAIGNESFAYDKLGRLATATVRGPDMQSLQTQTFGYDVYGNLTSTSKLGQTVNLTTTASTNHLDSLVYDASGNAIIAGTQRYAYDAAGMLNSVYIGSSQQPRVVYGYTADDERLLSFDVSAGATHWTVRGFDNKVLRDFKQQGATWSVERDYVYRDGLLLAALKGSGAVEHYSLDHLGTPRLITDSTAHKIGYHAYWPFGEEWSPGNAQEASPLQFTGHERDADLTGGTAPLDYMHARYYGAGWGRFLAADPEMDLRRTVPNPQLWNRYAYVTNNPLRFTDPTGREHVQEPGLTKPLSEADWSDAPPEIQASFRAEASLLSLAADEFVVGPVVGKVFGSISKELALSRSVMTALKSPNAAARLEGEAAVAVSESLVGFNKVVRQGGRVVGEIDVETTKAIVEVTGGSAPGKVAQVTKLRSNVALNPSGKPVIVFGPNLSRQAAAALSKAGAVVVRTSEELRAAVQ